MQFKLGLAQIAPRLGDMPANLRQHLDLIAQARQTGVDLLVFPELSLSGYYLRDLVADVALPADPAHPILAPLLEASRSLDLVVGLPEVDARFRYYISAAYLSGGRILHVHRKVYLPTYRLFDDARFFGPGDTFRAFDTRFGRMGLLICEDAWHLSAPFLLWRDGAEYLVDISASPGYGVTARGGRGLASKGTVDAFLQTYAELLTVFVVYVNRVGVEDGIAFGGGSAVVGPEGECLATCPELEPGFAIAGVDSERLRRARLRLPILRDERLDLVEREMSRLRHSNGDRPNE